MKAPAELTLDPFTLLFTLAWLCLQMGAVAHSLARPHGPFHHGLKQWGWGMMAGAGAFGLLVARPVIPFALSYWLGNALLLLCLVLLLAAYGRLFDRRLPRTAIAAVVVMAYSGLVMSRSFGLSDRIAPLTLALGISALLTASAVVLAVQVRRRATPARLLSLLMLLAAAGAMAWRAATLLMLTGIDYAPTAATRPQIAALIIGAAMITGSSLGFFFMVQDRHRLAAVDQARRDALTGLYTRAGFAELALSRLAEQAEPRFGLVLIDIDHFKAINDRHGHPAGDRVIAQVGRLIGRAARRQDLTCRYGGEEFLLLLAGADADRTGEIADRLVRLARRQPAPTRPEGTQPVSSPDHSGVSIAYTLSAGSTCASIPPSGPTLDLLERAIASADRALYDAKHQGRDRAVRARPLRPLRALDSTTASRTPASPASSRSTASARGMSLTTAPSGWADTASAS